MKMICPYCDGEIAFEIILDDVRKWHARRVDPDWWREGLTPTQLAIIDSGVQTGLLEAFAKAVAKRTAVAGQPHSVERFFLTFLKTMRQNRVPHFVLQHYIAEFGRHESIEIWSAQGVCAVIAGGRVKAFVPIDVFKGATIASVTGRSGSRIGGDEETFHAWVRTRFGYVPKSAEVFLGELRLKSIGEFAKPSLSAPD